MEISNFTFAIIIIILIAEIVALYFAIKYKKQRKQVSSTETSRISEISDGFHELKGRIIALSKPLSSPYDEKSCVYYNFKVEEHKSNGKTESWAGLISDKKMQRFGVHDGSGIALIDLKGAKIELKSEDGFNPDVNTDMKSMSYSNRERLLKRYGIRSQNGRYERTVRYRESILEEGAQVHIMGETREKDEGRPLFKAQEKALYVSDHSEEELLELYTNKFALTVGLMIAIPLIPVVFWLISLF